jgi:hypothetical protein
MKGIVDKPDIYSQVQYKQLSKLEEKVRRRILKLFKGKGRVNDGNGMEK